MFGRIEINSEKIEHQEDKDVFCKTCHVSKLMEKIIAALRSEESLLLIGETGCGKTTTIQYIAHKVKHLIFN